MSRTISTYGPENTYVASLDRRTPRQLRDGTRFRGSRSAIIRIENIE
jgi:hypothetical protein